MSKTQQKTIKISGYASVYNFIDYQNDLILPGACNNISALKYLPLLFQHNSSQILGKIVHIAENNIGLFIEAEITPTILGIDIATLIYHQSLKYFSIGFNTLSFDIYDAITVKKKFNISNTNKNQNNNIRVINNIDLIEISTVTFPANIKARIQTIINN